jgi:hypothetical protein
MTSRQSPLISRDLIEAEQSSFAHDSRLWLNTEPLMRSNVGDAAGFPEEPDNRVRMFNVDTHHLSGVAAGAHPLAIDVSTRVHTQ